MAPVVSFTINEEGVAGLREAITCLNKYNEEFSIEARADKFVLTAINSTKSGYAYFSFPDKFFMKYKFNGAGQSRNLVCCTLYSRIMMNIFRPRSSGVDSQGGIDRSGCIDHCDVSIRDEDDVQSRFVVRISLRNGCTVTQKVIFAGNPPVHAKFNAERAVHHWSIPSRTLRGVMDHFGFRAELLDISSEGDFINFAGITEKAVDTTQSIRGKPLRTQISLELDEFEEVEIEDDLHITVPIKEFRAIISHASQSGAAISTQYSTPGQPIKIKYRADVIDAEFVLMTVGDRASHTPAQGRKIKRKRGASVGEQLEAGSRRPSAPPSEATGPAPALPGTLGPQPSLASRSNNVGRKTWFDMRPSQAPPPRTQRALSESLFVPQDEDDPWEPIPDELDEDEGETVQWDGSRPQQTGGTIDRLTAMDRPEEEPPSSNASGLAPTQRLSDAQKMGIFFGGNSN